jgi:hypothetical protein
MKKKFSTLLLTGKAAALPFFIQPAQAYTPSFTDILNTQISQVEVPVADQVVLDSLGGDVYSGAVTLCTGANAVNNMSVVITGLKNKDYVYLIAATTLGGLESFDNRIKIGSENQKTQALGAVSAPDGATVAMSVPLDLSKITKTGPDNTVGSKFYMQTIVFGENAISSTGINWNLARMSEVDVVSVASCSTYGGPY